jgi:hypothetical protein
MQVGKHRCRRDDYIKVNLKETGNLRMWTGFIWLRTEPSGGSTENGNRPKPSVSLNGGKLLNQLSDY